MPHKIHTYLSSLTYWFSPAGTDQFISGNFKETLKVEQDTPVKQTGDEAQILSKLNIQLFLLLMIF